MNNDAAGQGPHERPVGRPVPERAERAPLPGADWAADMRALLDKALPPLPPSPVEVNDLMLPTREHVQALGWGNREQLYTASQVRALMAAMAGGGMTGDEACRFGVWWAHKRKTFTTTRQAAWAAWAEARSKTPNAELSR